MSATTTPRLNRELLRRRRAELGMSANALAGALGILNATYLFIENTGETLDLRLVVRLARILGISLDSLVTPAVLDDEPHPAVDDDAKVLGSLLYATDTLIPVGAICEALDWTLERLHAAEERLADQLKSCGLRLRRSNGRLAIARSPHHGGARTRTAGGSAPVIRSS